MRIILPRNYCRFAAVAVRQPHFVSACILFSLCSLVANPLFADLAWESTSKSIVVHPLQAEETVEFIFTNTDSDSVTILKLKPGCGCITGKVDKKVYAPGESGVVHVKFNLVKREGPQRKGISITTSAAPRKPVMLYVNTNIQPTFKPSVKRLTWLADEERKAKSFRIINSHKDAFRLAKAVAGREGVELELKPIREGYEYELVVTPSPDLKKVLIPIQLIPEKPDGIDKVKTFTVYALLK